MRKYILLLIIVALLLTGCSTTEPQSKRVYQGSAPEELRILTNCNDQVVCYYHAAGYNGGMDCFRDADLVKKYC